MDDEEIKERCASFPGFLVRQLISPLSRQSMGRKKLLCGQLLRRKHTCTPFFEASGVPLIKAESRTGGVGDLCREPYYEWVHQCMCVYTFLWLFTANITL